MSAAFKNFLPEKGIGHEDLFYEYCALIQGDILGSVSDDMPEEACSSSLDYVSNNEIIVDDSSHYFHIPENERLFNDVIIRNTLINSNNSSDFCDIGIQYKEVLGKSGLQFRPTIDCIGDLSDKYGHREIDANFKAVSHPDFCDLSENYEIDFLFVESTKTPLCVENNLT